MPRKTEILRASSSQNLKNEEQTFTFNYVPHEEVLNEIKNLQTTKTTQQNGIPKTTQQNGIPKTTAKWYSKKILKEDSEVLARYFHEKKFFYRKLDFPF